MTTAIRNKIIKMTGLYFCYVFIYSEVNEKEMNNLMKQYRETGQKKVKFLTLFSKYS